MIPIYPKPSALPPFAAVVVDDDVVDGGGGMWLKKKLFFVFYSRGMHINFLTIFVPRFTGKYHAAQKYIHRMLWVYSYIIIIINFIYNVPVPVLQKRAPSTVQLHILGSIHS